MFRANFQSPCSSLLIVGQIASLTGGEDGNESPLAVEMYAYFIIFSFSCLFKDFPSSRFVIVVSCIAIIFALVFFAVGITSVYKGKAAATVTFAVSILVAFVPEGLPSVVTLLLSIAAKRMAKQNVLVKDLQGVETLGAFFFLSFNEAFILLLFIFQDR